MTITSTEMNRDKSATQSAGAWRSTALLAFLSLLSALLLTGTSVWLLGAVALAGAGGAAYTFNFHIPAALIRLFAVSRTASKYGERLYGHQAALTDQVARRIALVTAIAMAPKTRNAGWQLGDEDKLADFIDDVEDLDYARLRVGLPLATVATGLAIVMAATAYVAPAALLLILPIFLLTVACGFFLLPSTAEKWKQARYLHRKAGRELGAGLASVIALRAEGAWSDVVTSALTHLGTSDRQIMALRRETVRFDLLAAALGPLAAASVLAAAWLNGLRGEALLPAAFTAFLWIALSETLQGLSRILLARVKKEAAAQNLASWTADASKDVGESLPVGPVAKLEISGMMLHAPDGRALGRTIDLMLRRGAPTVFVGPSGCGKTSLLKQIAGWLDAGANDAVLADGQPVGASQRRALVHFALHDAAILADTVRENLFAPSASEEDCWKALEAVEMDSRIRKAGGLDAWIQQDALSLGEAQRLNLARAFLTTRPIIILDEPGEHLDTDQARRILQRLTDRFSDRILLFSSHQQIWNETQMRIYRL